MLKHNIGGFVRISRREARRRYEAGEPVRMCAVKMSPVNVWGAFADVRRETISQIGGDGFNFIVPRSRDFQAVVNAFEHYNCNAETGKYAAFYIPETAVKSRYKAEKEAARNEAIEWQGGFSSRSMSWGELAEWQEHFARLGRKYGLLREFADNGII